MFGGNVTGALFLVYEPQPTRMDYTLGVRINGDKISDQAAKIITLKLRGLSNGHIANVTFIKKGTIYPIISNLYALLGIEHELCLLKYEALKSGFDYKCKWNGVDLLTPAELQRLYREVPRLLHEKTELIITVHQLV